MAQRCMSYDQDVEGLNPARSLAFFPLVCIFPPQPVSDMPNNRSLDEVQHYWLSNKMCLAVQLRARAILMYKELAKICT